MSIPELEINLVEFAPKGPSRLTVHVRGVWRGRSPRRRRPVLVVDVGGRQRRFSPAQAPRRATFEPVADWSASFVVPAALGPALDGNMSLAFGDDELIPLPSLFDARAEPAREPEEPRRTQPSGGRRRRPQLERRPVTENGRARRAARLAEQTRTTTAGAKLARELDSLRRELDETKAERDKYYRTADGMAKHVAKMHMKMTAAVNAEQELAAERDRLTQDLESLRAELHAAAKPSKRAGTAGKA